MDAAHAAAFYVAAAIAILGALLTALGRSRRLEVAGLLVTALGTGLVMADLSAGFAALLTVLLIAAAAVVSAAAPSAEEPPPTRADNLGAIAAAVLFAALAYAAYRGLYHSAGYPGGQFNAGALGRLLVGRDALALMATAAAALIALRALPARSRR